MNELYKDNQGLFATLGLIIGILTIYLAIIQPILNYTRTQKKLTKDKRFKTYHDLIDHFAGANGNAKLDRQIVIIFELRNFPEYYSVTKRILRDWIAQRENIDHPNSERLINEMELTVKYIESSWFTRKFNFKN